ncbi:Secreted protein containing DUF1552 [Planctomycetales bacterium 10988]|nr:Secreted protein containing DUF1552 [Planctomycetales bacterium 10988]
MPSRRGFLRAAGTVVALPLLESLGMHRTAAAALAPVAARPKRMIFLSFGWGVTRESWFPKRGEVGENYTLPLGLKPLERHKQDLTIIQGLANTFSNEAHWGSTFYLTGANRYAEPGQNFSNSISADQVAAQVFGQNTRFTSLQLSCRKAEDSGHGPGLSLSWDGRGKPMAGMENPVQLYHKLFSETKTPLEERQAMLDQKKSVLDTVLADAKGVKRGLNYRDTQKLDEYYQSIRDIEVRLSKEEQWLTVPKKQPSKPVKLPNGELEGYEEIKLMYDLMVAALETDATRVLTYRQPVDTLLQSIGTNMTAHNMSHYSPGPRMDVSQARDENQSKLLAHLLDRLKAIKEPDGSSLYDHTAISYGSNINSLHYLSNCPTVLTGGGAGINHGRHLVMKEEKTPLCNLWLSMLQGVGLPVQSHGDSTGIIPELFA